MKMIAFVLLVGLLIAGCSSQEMGTLVVKLTDAPAVDLEKAIVTISNVEVHTGGDAGNWSTVVAGPKTYDLMQLRNVSELLGEAQLAPGQYTQIRLAVESAKVTVAGEEHELTVPSDTVKLTHQFTIAADTTTTLTLDFDAAESVVAAGDKYQLKPTIKVLQD